MKKLIYIMAIALGIASCAKEEFVVSDTTKEAVKYIAVIEDTKTFISIEGGKGKVSWVAGDEVILTDGETEAVYVATPDEMYPSTAEFALKAGETAPEGPIIGAKYGDVNNQVFDPEHIGSNCPMEADAPENNVLKFRNTCGVLRIRATSNGITLKRIEIGKYALDINNADITTATTFDIALPDSTYENLKIYFISSDNRICTKTYKGDLKITKNHLTPIDFSNALSFDGYGALNGEFEINDKGDKVRFSPGNLYFEGNRSTGVGEWKFEANQYDFRTCQSQSSSFNGIATIGSGTPGNTYGLLGWRFEGAPDNNVQCLPATPGTVDHTKFKDWGNDVKGYEWRTLSESEMTYLLNNYKHKLSKIGVNPSSNGTNGIVFIPEKVTVSTTEIQDTYNLADWKDAEANGAVFLPAAGYINGGSTGVQKANVWCEYWLSDYDGDGKIYHFNTQSSGGTVQTPTSNRQAFAVRLVSDVLK